MSASLHHAFLRNQPRARRRARGFTLAEMSVAMSVAGLLLAGITTFYVESTQNFYNNEQQMYIGSDMRYLTELLSSDARQADFFTMYTDYTTGNRSSSTQELAQSNSGDFLVLVTFGTAPNPLYFNVRPVNQIIGYYREPYTGNQTDVMSSTVATLDPIRRFVLTVGNGIPSNYFLETSPLANLPAGATQGNIEALLPANTTAVMDSHQIIVDFSEGLNNNRLFYNFWGKSIMVNGEIYHGNNFSSATATYNFTISPRG